MFGCAKTAHPGFKTLYHRRNSRTRLVTLIGLSMDAANGLCKELNISMEIF